MLRVLCQSEAVSMPRFRRSTFELLPQKPIQLLPVKRVFLGVRQWSKLAGISEPLQIASLGKHRYKHASAAVYTIFSAGR